MARLDRHLVARMIPWLFASLAVAALVFVASQAVRVAPIFVGASGSSGRLAEALALLLVPVMGWALTPAFAIAVFAVYAGMSASGEQIALDAAGVPRWRSVLGPATLGLAVLLASAWLWSDASWRSQARLRAIAMDLAGEALVGRLAPGRFVEPARGVTFWADGRSGAAFDGVMIEDARDPDRTLQIGAARAVVSFDRKGAGLLLRLRDGVIFAEPSAERGPAALAFREMEVSIPIGEEISGRTGFLPPSMSVPTARLADAPEEGMSRAQWEYALWRRIAGPCGFLAMAVVSMVLAVRSSWRRRWPAIALGAGVFLAYHLLGRLAETIMLAGAIGGVAAALSPSAAVLATALIAWAGGRSWRRRGGRGEV